MRFGVCTELGNAAVVAQLGFDYFECSISSLAEMERDMFERLADGVLRAGIRCEAGNVMMPSSIRLTGEEADHDAAMRHLEVAIPRLRELGGEIAVFGAGGARRVPEGFAGEAALEQLAAFLRRAGDICAASGVRVAIEPLNRAECNIVVSVAEALRLAGMAAHPAVGVLADWYHVTAENEGTEGIRSAGQKLWHCHIACPGERAYPRPGDGGYAAFFRALRAIGYDARVSVEGRGEIAQDGAAALEALRAAVVL